MFQDIDPQEAIHAQFRRQWQHEGFDIGETLCAYLHAGKGHDRGRYDAMHRRNAFLTHRSLRIQIEFERNV